MAGVLSAAFDLRLQDTMPDDTERVLAVAREYAVSVTFRDVHPDVWRMCAGIPAGFPIWYVPPCLALPAAPERLALPWGDSCYTSAVYVREDWASTWCLGPLSGLTPSGEGPRGEARAMERLVQRMLSEHGRRW